MIYPSGVAWYKVSHVLLSRDGHLELGLVAGQGILIPKNWISYHSRFAPDSKQLDLPKSNVLQSSPY